MAIFTGRRGFGHEARFTRIEQYLTGLGNLPAILSQLLATGQQGFSGGGQQAILTPPGGGSGSGSSGQIPESQVVFDPAQGHAHDGTGSHIVALAGDVTGDNTAAVVARAQGVPVTAPVAGNDGQVLQYQNAGPDFGYTPITTLGTIGSWTQADISALAGADAEIPNGWAGSVVIGNVMPGAGALVGMAIRLTADINGAGNNLVCTAYKNGVATAVTVTLAGAVTPVLQAFATFTPVAFAAGDLLTVQAHKAGAPAAVRAAVQLFGRFS